MTDKNKNPTRKIAPLLKDNQSLGTRHIVGRHLQVSREDMEQLPGLKQVVLQHAAYIDTIMEVYYIHAGNKYCPWISMQLAEHRYVNIEITSN